MPLLKLNSNNDEKEIKDIIDKNIGNSFRIQQPFIHIIHSNGCPLRKSASVGQKIRKQLLKEAKNGNLTADTVIPRAYELIGEFLEINDVKTNEFEIIHERGFFHATLPYTSSGVRIGQAGRNAFGGASYLSTSIGEGQTNWKNSKVFFVEKGLRIEETGQFIHYKQIDYIDYSENPNKKALIDFKRNTIVFIMKNGEQIIMRVMAGEFYAIKHCIEIDMKNIEKTHNPQQTEPIQQNISIASTADELLKYAELYEKGLLTKEEFDLKKSELLSNETIISKPPEYISEIPLGVEQKNKFCSNCGSEVEIDSRFCSNCGSKI